MPPADTRYARIWDAPVRLFHWLLVGLLGLSWWSGEQHAMEWHRWSGYAILALLIFRIYWGFFGGRTARFDQFLRGPRAALTYLRALGTGRHHRADGHNPVGGWSVALMLAALAAMVGAGLFAVDVDGLESGPLADYVSFDTGRAASGLHSLIFNLLLALVGLHIVAIIAYLVALRTDLIGPMIMGRRRVSADTPIEPLRASPWKALIGALLAGVIAGMIARGFRW